MESIVRITSELETSTTSDLDAICEIANSPCVAELSDNIKLNISAWVTEIKTLIENKVRLRELSIRPDNHFLKAHGRIAVGVFGTIRNIRSTLGSRGAGYISWNKLHKLNVHIDNTMTVKSHNSSTDLALLALLHQANEIKLKRVHIFTASPHLNNMVENLNLFHLQNYQDQRGIDISNKLVWKKIYEAIKERDIILSFTFPPIPQPLSETYETLISTAKCGVRERMAQLIRS